MSSDKELAKSIIDDVLSSSEFQPKKKADLSMFDKYREFIQKIYKAVIEFIQELLEKIFGNFNWFGFDKTINGLSKTAKLIIYIISIAFIILLAYLLVKLITKIIRNSSFRHKKDNVSDELEEFTKSPDAPLKLALEHKSNKQYRLAFRYFFLALLIKYNERELIVIQKFKTNRHYIRELYSSNNELAMKSEPFFNAFYLIWYGKREINEESLDKWENMYYSLTEVKKEGEVIAK